MTAPAAAPLWHEDVLGRGFEVLELSLSPDDEGPVSASLVRHTAAAGLSAAAQPAGRPLPALRSLFRPRRAGRPPVTGTGSPPQVVLYLHGRADYFLQTELAVQLGANGFHLGALQKTEKIPRQAVAGGGNPDGMGDVAAVS